jgi:2-(1,2-epoxy-1,2-dihydrophenyl)acetyl-CoA isomerase
MTESTPSAVRIDTADDILHIVLDRPEAKNSLTPDVIRDVIDALEAAAATDSVRVVAISSTGPDFCAGADVIALNDGTRERPRVGNLQRRTAVQAHRLIEVITSIQVPVVCAVRGWAAGLGFQLALAADFTIVSETARFWEPFCPRGFTPDSGATWFLPRLVGVARAKEILMLGRELTGAEAAEWGMIHRCVPDDSLDAEATELVRDLASRATIALGLTKHCVNGSLVSGLTDAMAREASALELSSRTADFREGLASFKEHRRPDFQGR